MANVDEEGSSQMALSTLHFAATGRRRRNCRADATERLGALNVTAAVTLLFVTGTMVSTLMIRDVVK